MGKPVPSRFDPPDLGVRDTVVRLARVGREQWRLSALGLALAFLYTVLTIAIPLLVARAIDRSILHHEEPLAPLLAAIAAVAIVRAVVNFERRYATARVGVRVEARMRELLFHSYLRFPRGFFDTMRRARSSRARRTTSTRSAISSAGASCRARRAR